MLSAFKRRKLKKVIKQALADGVLTDDEVQLIELRRDELGLPESVVTDLRTAHFQKTIDPLIGEISAYRRLTDRHLEQLRDLSKKLRVKLDIPSEFAMYRLLWLAEERGEFDPPRIDPPTNVRLTKGEVCYHICSSNWLRVKTRRKTQYVGSSMSFRVAKGVSFRVGGAQPIRHEWEEVVPNDFGSLCLTNKKLVFIGESMKSCTITFGALSAWEVLKEGIVLHKSRGPAESPFENGDSLGVAFVIHTMDVDTRDARPHGHDRAEDEALSDRSHR